MPRVKIIDAFQWDGTYKSTLALARWFKKLEFDLKQFLLGMYLDASPTPVMELQNDEWFHNGGEVLIMIPGEWVVYDAREDYFILMNQEELDEYCLPRVPRKGTYDSHN